MFLVIAVAIVGKVFGCTLAARLSRLTWRESFTVGVLMNCKGYAAATTGASPATSLQCIATGWWS